MIINNYAPLVGKGFPLSNERQGDDKHQGLFESDGNFNDLRQKDTQNGEPCKKGEEANQYSIKVILVSMHVCKSSQMKLQPLW